MPRYTRPAPSPRTARGSFAARLLVLVAALVPAVAGADAVEGPPVVRDPFREQDRFTLRDLRLGGQGNEVMVERGGAVEATVDLEHDCRGCAGAINQIIVGLGGEDRAQACIWEGSARSHGWRSARFTLRVPDRPGVYEVRARYAQARSCREALGWWRVDRPQGPTAASTIGVITVGVVAPPPVPVQPPAPPVPIVEPAHHRPPRVIRADITHALDDIEHLTERLADRSGHRRVHRLAERIHGHVTELRRLQQELAEAWRHRRRRGALALAPAPVAPPPPVVVVPPPPTELPAPRFSQLMRDLEGQASDRSRLRMLQDHLGGDIYFSSPQAVRILGAFSFGGSKVDAGAALCPVILDEDALPRLTSALTFESHRSKLRSRVKGGCGGYRPALPVGR